MTRTAIDVVRELFRALDADDYAGALRLFDPDVEWNPTEGSYRGLEGLGASLIEWLEPWDEHRIEAEAFTDNGDRVLAEIRLTARGGRSGMEIDQRFFQVYWVTAGLIKRMDEYVTRDDALERMAAQSRSQPK